VTIRSKELASWRRQRPSETLLANDPDLLWSSEFINVDRNLYFVELFACVKNDDSAARRISLVEVPDRLRAIVIPVLECFESPQLCAARLPDNWLVLAAPLVEWALSASDRSSARQIAERMMRIRPQEGKAFEVGRALYVAGKRPALGLGSDAVGWLAARHTLFGASESLRG
jgi:hypothetical protein